MARIAMELTNVELDILEKIVGFGGYATKEIINLYRKDISSKRCYIILSNLEKKQYLKKVDYFESSMENMVYQVTGKACSYFGRKEAYMRKKHNKIAIRRYLLRSHFLFSFIGNGGKISLYSTMDRQRYMNSILGVRDYYLPKKIHKDTINVHMEEYIIEPEEAKNRTIYFLYPDDSGVGVDFQMGRLMAKYEKLDMLGEYFIEFLIATETESRAKEYIKIYGKKYFREISMINLKAESQDRIYRATLTE